MPSQRYEDYFRCMPDFGRLHNTKAAGLASQENETSTNVLAFQGSYKVYEKGVPVFEVTGNGHHGADYVGVASVRNGKGLRTSVDTILNTRIV